MSSWMPEPGSPLDRVATFLMANLLWVLCAVFILPLPAATAGLFAALAPWVRGKDSEFFAAFFGAIRRFWLKSTIIVVVDVVLGGVILANFQALRLMGLDELVLIFASSANLLIFLTLLMINVDMWPLLVLFDLRLRRLLDVSLRMVLAHPIWSLLALMLALLPLAVALFLPAILSLLFVFSAMALAIHWGAWRIIRKYATPEELAELDQPG
jgi:uncharacterized membrane protein YesL